MSKYRSDRNFTDYVHAHLAVPLIYKPLNWTIDEDISASRLQKIDMQKGIDYVLKDETGKQVYVQERFRESKYKSYNDTTLRYERKENSIPDRQKSEFNKIKADYLVYGIVNGDKKQSTRNQLSDFYKYVVLDLHFIREKFKMKKVQIVPSQKRKCWTTGDVLCCPENFNHDGSSSFIPLDIPIIQQLWGSAPILASKGYPKI
jgi:hypothetical protein